MTTRSYDPAAYDRTRRALDPYTGDHEESVIDLLTDLRHYAAAHDLDWTKVVDLAELHYDDEVNT